MGWGERERDRKGRGTVRWKEDLGWNFNDREDGTGERNLLVTRSLFSFAKTY